MKRYGWVFAAVCFPVLFGMNYVPVNALPILCAAAFAVALALFFLRKRIRIVPAALCGAAGFRRRTLLYRRKLCLSGPRAGA